MSHQVIQIADLGDCLRGLLPSAEQKEPAWSYGVQGYGWRDEAWGGRDMIGTVTLRFPLNGSALHFLRIQSREDGAMIDQIVLSSRKYKTTRPGRTKNDTTILPDTTRR
jgi:hypothetical protein